MGQDYRPIEVKDIVVSDKGMILVVMAFHPCGYVVGASQKMNMIYFEKTETCKRIGRMTGLSLLSFHDLKVKVREKLIEHKLWDENGEWTKNEV